MLEIQDTGTSPTDGADGDRPRPPLLGFEEVPVGSADTVVVPRGYVAEVIVPWGTPLSSRGPAWPDASDRARRWPPSV